MYSTKTDDATDGHQMRNSCVRVMFETRSVVAKTRYRDADPVIERFRATLTSIQVDELKRLYNRLPALDEHSRKAIGQFAECLVATVLRPPLECLQSESGEGASQELVDALQRLFQLEN